MRNIKFRGKVADEPNEWIYGYLVRKDAIFQEKPKSTGCCGFGTFTVDENSIGQYTGLKDKNGTEIYEGDIIRNINDFVYSGNYCFEVMFENGIFIGYTKDKFLEIYTDNFKYCEIIGNIFDNPELLEVKDE